MALVGVLLIVAGLSSPSLVLRNPKGLEPTDYFGNTMDLEQALGEQKESETMPAVVLPNTTAKNTAAKSDGALPPKASVSNLLYIKTDPCKQDSIGGVLTWQPSLSSRVTRYVLYTSTADCKARETFLAEVAFGIDAYSIPDGTGRNGAKYIILVTANDVGEAEHHQYVEIRDNCVDDVPKVRCTNEAGGSGIENRLCVFPFEYKGVNHYTCIGEDIGLLHANGWCAVRSTIAGASDWGWCKPESEWCPQVSDDKLSLSDTIDQKRTLSNSTAISMLYTSAGLPAIDSRTSKYRLETPLETDVTALRITVVAAEGATVIINELAVANGVESPEFPLRVGNNVFTIQVIAEDGEHNRETQLTVKRQQPSRLIAFAYDLSNSVTQLPSLVCTCAVDGNVMPMFDRQLAVFYCRATDTTTPCAIKATSNEFSFLDLNGAGIDQGETVPLHVGDCPTLNDIEVSAHNGIHRRHYSLYVLPPDYPNSECSRTVATSSIVLSTGTLEPSFASNVFLYTTEVGAEVQDISVAVTTAVKTTVRVQLRSTTLYGIESGEMSPQLMLLEGPNRIQISITAPDALYSQTYTVTVFRAFESLDPEASSESALLDISTSARAIVPVFQRDLFDYAVIMYEEDAFTLTVTPQDWNCHVQLNNAAIDVNVATENFPVPSISAQFQLVVRAPDLIASSIYSFTIVRPFGVAPAAVVLTSLSVDNGVMTPAFTPSQLHYSVTVDSSVDTVQLIVESFPWMTVAQSPPENLLFGSNRRVVKVASPSAAEQSAEYVVTIVRRFPPPGLGASSSTALTMDTSLGTPSPLKDGEATLTVPHQHSSIQIKTTPSEGAFVSINELAVVPNEMSREIELLHGTNQVRIAVVAQDGITEASYLLLVKRELPPVPANPSSDAKIVHTTAPFSKPFNPLDFGPYTVEFLSMQSRRFIIVVNRGSFLFVNGIAFRSGYPIQLQHLWKATQQRMEITVLAEDQQTKAVYWFDFTHSEVQKVLLDLEKQNCVLSDLDINDGALVPPFASTHRTYSIHVDADVEVLELSPKMDSECVAVVEGSSVHANEIAHVHLVPGPNTISMSLGTALYKLHIVRELPTGGKSSTSLLRRLDIDPNVELDPPFNPITLMYTARVPEAVSSVMIHANPEGGGFVSVNQNSIDKPVMLGVGSNRLAIVSTAEDAVASTPYLVRIVRGHSSATPSSRSMKPVVPEVHLSCCDVQFDAAKGLFHCFTHSSRYLRRWCFPCRSQGQGQRRQ